MNVNIMWEEYENRLKNLEEMRKDIFSKFEEAKENTDKFLAECKNVGIKCVSIGTYTDKIESAKIWGKYGNYNNIFADEESEDGWPAIWKVAQMENKKYSGGCGNRGQHSFNCATFIEGVYSFKHGKWFRYED